MKFALEDLTLNKIALVDVGANPEAYVELFKRDSGGEEDMSKETKDTSVEDLKKQLADAQKQAEVLTKERDEAKAALEKAAPKKEPSPDDVLKSLDGPAKELVLKLQAEATEATKAAKDTAERLAKLEEQRGHESWVRKASEYKNIAKADDLGATLHAIAKAVDKDTLEALTKTLATANVAAEALYGEFGARGSEDSSAVADKIEKRVEEIRKSDPKVSLAKAHETAMQEFSKELHRERAGR